MANLISLGSGNFTAAGTWGLCDSGTSAFLDSESGTTAVTTSDQDSAAFTPSANQSNAIAVKVSSIAASPAGTFSIKLKNFTAGTTVQTITVNVSDLPKAGWVVFLFSNFTPNGTDQYKVSCVTSNSSQVTLYTNGTSANWTRAIRRTSTQAPAAGDWLLMAGELTGAGTSNSFSITMNSNTNTAYGNGSTSIPSVMISHKAICAYGTAGSTTYHLKVNGLLAFEGDGLFKIGDSSTRIPSSSTANLEFATSTSAGQGFIMRNGSTFRAYGDNSRTPWSLLKADVSATGTVLNVGTVVGWAANDQIVIASTSTTASQTETATIQSIDYTDPNNVLVTLTGGLSNAHLGTAPMQAEVINVTRNVKIFSAGNSTTTGLYSTAALGSSLDWDNVEVKHVTPFTGGKNGLQLPGDGSGTNMVGCSFHTMTNSASLIVFTASGNGTANINIYDTVVSTPNGTTFSAGFNTIGTIDGCVWMATGGGTGVSIANELMVINDNRFINQQMSLSNVGSPNTTCVTVTNNTWHTGSTGISLNSTATPYSADKIHDNTFWNLTTSAISMGSAASTNPSTNYRSIGALTAWGCTNQVLNLGSSTLVTWRWKFYDWVCNSQIGSSAVGVSAIATTSTNNLGLVDIHFLNCEFGETSAFTNLFLNNGTAVSSQQPYIMTFNNCKVNATNVIGGTAGFVNNSNVRYDSRIEFINFNQNPDDQRVYFKYGIQTKDVVIYDANPQSVRLAPVSNSVQLESDPIYIPINAGEALDISMAMRMSASGDPSGADYNGSVKPSLVLLANPAVGVDSDTQLDIMAGSVGSWETLNGTTPVATNDGVLTIVSRGQGTTGWWNMGDLDVAVA